MYNVYIRPCKDTMKQWAKLPFIATDDTIFTILETWPLEWHTPDLAELEKVAAHKKKDDAKMCVTQLAEKRWKEKVAAEVWVVREVAQKAADQKKAIEAATVAHETEAATTQANEGQEMSSQGQEEEEIETAEGSVDLGTTST